MSCPPFEDLLSWLEARPDDGPAAPGPVTEHIAGGCTACERRLALLDRLARTMGRPAPVPVPSALRRATLERLAEADAAARPVAGHAPSAGQRLAGSLHRVREHLAELLLAGPTPALAAGLRGVSDAAHRVYGAGPYQVDVALIERSSVLGQVSGDPDAMRDLAGATCILVGPSVARETSMEPDGAFRFEGLSPASFALMIDAAGSRLVLPDVDLRDEPDPSS